MPANTPAREFITHEPGNDEAWTCVCGNRPNSNGFYPCDEEGNEMEPTMGSDWDGLYVCGNCGRIVRQGILEVIGRNPNWKRLE